MFQLKTISSCRWLLQSQLALVLPYLLFVSLPSILLTLLLHLLVSLTHYKVAEASPFCPLNQHRRFKYEFLVERRYCFQCKSMQDYRTRHCLICGRCVRRYDHHCMLIGICIGAGNYHFFLLFCLSQSFFGLVSTMNVQETLRQLSHGPLYWLFCALGVTFILLWTAASFMFLFHLKLIWNNETTWQFNRREQLDYIKPFGSPFSPFDGGVGQNVHEILISREVLEYRFILPSLN